MEEMVDDRSLTFPVIRPEKSRVMPVKRERSFADCSAGKMECQIIDLPFVSRRRIGPGGWITNCHLHSGIAQPALCTDRKHRSSLQIFNGKFVCGLERDNRLFSFVEQIKWHCSIATIPASNRHQ